MELLIFFALPVATIILAIVLQKILRCPVLVALTFFAVYLIVAFTVFAGNVAIGLIVAIVYTIIAYITANIVNLLCHIKNRMRECNCGNNNINTVTNGIMELNNENINQTMNNQNGIIETNCSCNNGNNQNSSNTFAVNTQLTPNSNNNGRTGAFRGCYRRF